MIQQFTFDGNGRQIDAQGVAFRYESGESGDGITELALWIDGNAIGTLEPGDLLELPTAAKRWEVKPVSPTCKGVVKVGLGKITTAKVAGVVSTVDGAKARTMGGTAFSAYAYQPASSTNFSYINLWNNVGSGKNVVVNDVMITLTSGFSAGVSMSQIFTPEGSYALSGLSKKLGGAQSAACGLRIGTRLTSLVYLMRLWYFTGVSESYRPIDPIVLPPGTGLLFQTTHLDSALGLSVDWWEEPA